MSDIFPRRNLPPEAEEWGREIENRVFSLENGTVGTSQSLSSSNRATASNLSNIAEQLRILEGQVDQIEALYNALPLVRSGVAAPSNFGLSGGWQTIASVSLTMPSRAGTFSVSGDAGGQLVSGSTSTLMGASFRLLLNGGASSAVIPGLYASPTGTWVNNFSLNWGWSVSTSPGASVTISLQANPQDAASWGGGTGSFAVLSVFGTFAGA